MNIEAVFADDVRGRGEWVVLDNNLDEHLRSRTDDAS